MRSDLFLTKLFANEKKLYFLVLVNYPSILTLNFTNFLRFFTQFKLRTALEIKREEISEIGFKFSFIIGLIRDDEDFKKMYHKNSGSGIFYRDTCKNTSFWKNFRV
jgi:hypothetical protein